MQETVAVQGAFFATTTIPGRTRAAYAEAGAAAISVLTEPTFFDGSPEHLEQVRAAVEIPILRKDFIVTDYQLAEAAALGAEAALLIVAALSDAELRSLLTNVRSAGAGRTGRSA